MKQRFYLFLRGTVYYIQDAETGAQKSLQTRDPDEAEALLQAKLQAVKQPQLNVAIAKVHLAAADPKLVCRMWREVMQEFVDRSGKDSTRTRRERALRHKAFDPIRERKIIETTGDEFRTVIKAGGVFTSHCLKCVHNLAQGLGWLPWPIIPAKLWPKSATKRARAITADEHQRIIAAEKNIERRLYYELLWETGAAQSDAANLTAEDIDWKARQLSYQRMKTGEWCHLSTGDRLEHILCQLPSKGMLFPKIAALRDAWRSAEFNRRCKLLRIEGCTLHSYRYAWAERAYVHGVPERFAQAALGHSSKAVHWAYARKGRVVCPSLEEYETKLVAVEFSKAG